MLMSANYAEGAAYLGLEQNYRALQKVYEYLGAPDNLQLRFRASYHATTAGDIEAYIDFLDNAFGRVPALDMKPNLVFDYTFEKWKQASGETRTAPAGDKLVWALGTEPPQVSYPAGYANHSKFGDHVMTAPGILECLFQPVKSDKMKVIHVPFGADLRADLYVPLNHTGKLPLVVWLHPFAGAGYVMYESNILEQRIGAIFEELISRGYAVLAFDQIGFGTRVEHAKEFYNRYPRWSLLGKMVADTRAAISAGSALEMIDASRVYLLGYALGSKVALWTGAFDPRPAGIVAIAGVTPLRTSTGIEGIYGYSHLHGLLPRLGFYVNEPESVPVDYEDVFARLQSRKVLLVAPVHDRFVDSQKLRNMMNRFRNVEIVFPDDFNRFSREIQLQAFDWMDRQRMT
jgi:Dipeptidyl aminopeptidases/acylaminoacyl-peptidases